MRERADAAFPRDRREVLANTADGQKFLVLEPQRSGGETLTFTLNWAARLSNSK